MLQAAGSWLSTSSKATGKLECWKVVFGYLEQLSDIYFTYSDKTTFFLQNTRTLEEINKKEALFQRLINHFGLLKKKREESHFFFCIVKQKESLLFKNNTRKITKIYTYIHLYIVLKKDDWWMKNHKFLQRVIFEKRKLLISLFCNHDQYSLPRFF